MSVSDETILFNTNADEGENRQAAMVLQEVYAALKEAGHNPTVQLVGYLFQGSRHILPAAMTPEGLFPASKEMNWWKNWSVFT